MASRPPFCDDQRARYLRGEVTVTAPTKQTRIGKWTVVCLALNRTIGSGIHVTPALVLRGTGTVGASLLLWAFGRFLATCGLLVWLELGLYLPLAPRRHRRTIPKTDEDAPRPRYLVRCMYGVAFVLLGNLSGNAIAFGIYIMKASGYTGAEHGAVIGAAIGALTLAVAIHLVSRRGIIIINNCFALLKVALLLTIILLGFINAGGKDLGGGPKATDNFDPDNSFSNPEHNVASYSNSLLFIIYTYGGWEQPFHVLAEVRTPRRIFPKYTLLAMAISITLYVLVNVAYFCAIPRDLPDIAQQRNMGIVFFGRMSGNEAAKRVMAAVIAVSIFGNVLVLTFTASRVKQEIAKEGILPKSLFFATSYTTPLARWQNRNRQMAEGEYLDQAPMAALGLHWFTSVFLVAVTSGLKPAITYSVLVSMYNYTVIIMVGFFTASRLVYLHTRPSLEWRPSFRQPGGWIHAAIYSVACLFMLCACFVPAVDESIWSYNATGVMWYVIPTIALSVPLWSVVWYFGLQTYMTFKGETLVVKRDPKIDRDEGSDELRWITEIIIHEWHASATLNSSWQPFPMQDIHRHLSSLASSLAGGQPELEDK